MKKDKLKLLKPKGGIWALDKKGSLLSLERAVAALGYEMEIRTRPLPTTKEEK